MSSSNLDDLTERYNRLLEEEKESQTKLERAKGQLELLTSQLKSEFDCDDINEAKQLLAQYREDYEGRQRQVERLLDKVEKATTED